LQLKPSSSEPAGAGSFWRRIVRALGWTRSSYFLMSVFLATVVLIDDI
jgi:hypothetical protein